MNNTHTEKFESILTLIQTISEQYKDSTPAQKQILETTIGAAIFYLPTKKSEHFTGLISEEALVTGERVKEHLYPRKWVANQLLTNPPKSVEEFTKLLNEKYLTYNFTTKSENKRLVPYQKVGVFTSPETSYQKADIKLVTV